MERQSEVTDRLTDIVMNEERSEVIYTCHILRILRLNYIYTCHILRILRLNYIYTCHILRILRLNYIYTCHILRFLRLNYIHLSYPQNPQTPQNLLQIYNHHHHYQQQHQNHPRLLVPSWVSSSAIHQNC